MISCLVEILCGVGYLVLLGGFVFPVIMNRFVSGIFSECQTWPKNPKFFLHKCADPTTFLYEMILFREGSKAIFQFLL